MLLLFRFPVYVTDGLFEVGHIIPTRWVHATLNHFGSKDGQGVRMYLDGIEVASDTTKLLHLSATGDGRIIAGKLRTDSNACYASVEVDELIFFNQSLTNDKVQSIYNSV